MRDYYGLCVGGPLDGQYRLSVSPSFNAAKDVPVLDTPVGPSGCDVADQTFTTMTYTHSPWRAPKSDRTFDLWIPSTLSVAEAIAMVQNGYHVHKAASKRSGLTAKAKALEARLLDFENCGWNEVIELRKEVASFLSRL